VIKIIPILLLLLAGINYGLIFPINAIVVKENSSYFGHAFWQTAISGVVLLLVAKALKKPICITRNCIKVYFLVGVFAFSIPMSILTLVSSKIPVGMTSLVMGLSPAFTYLLGIIVRIDRFSTLGVLGVSFGFAGLVFLVLPELYIPSSTILPWFCLALVTPVCLAIANISATIYQPTNSSAIVLGAGFLIAAALTTFPVATLTDQFYWPLDRPIVIPTLIAAVVNVLHIILFTIIIKSYGPTFFSQFNYVIVACAIFWSFILFNEIPSFSVIIPLVFITLGVLISSSKRQ